MLNPAPYNSVAVASTFSPRFIQVLAEAKRIGRNFGADLSLIYVGEKSEETAARFRAAFEQLSLPLATGVHYEQGDPADAILRALSENSIELIVAGALEEQVVLHPFLGNVARRLVREANCSVMLFTQPEAEPKPLRKIVFVADHSPRALEALKKTIWLAAAEASERLHVIRVITAFEQARAKAAGKPDKLKTADAEEAALEEFVLSAGSTEVPIETRCVRGNTGFVAADFVRAIGADLLVVPVAPSSGGELPNNIAWLTEVIPCNLWLVRSAESQRDVPTTVDLALEL
ncbi:MAG: universal stress protein [Chthoniobacterales bacterium]